MGKCIEYLEILLRKVFRSERTAGIFLTGIIVLGSYLITFKIISIFYGFGKVWGISVSIIIIFYSLSIRDLLNETGES